MPLYKITKTIPYSGRDKYNSGNGGSGIGGGVKTTNISVQGNTVQQQPINLNVTGIVQGRAQGTDTLNLVTTSEYNFFKHYENDDDIYTYDEMLKDYGNQIIPYISVAAKNYIASKFDSINNKVMFVCPLNDGLHYIEAFESDESGRMQFPSEQIVQYGGGGSGATEVYWVQSGDTLQTIDEQKALGKLIMLLHDSKYYYYTNHSVSLNDKAYFRSFDNTNMYVAEMDRNGVYVYTTVPLGGGSYSAGKNVNISGNTISVKDVLTGITSVEGLTSIIVPEEEDLVIETMDGEGIPHQLKYSADGVLSNDDVEFQKKLIAGAGISISGNTISATGGGGGSYSAGKNISISGNTISVKDALTGITSVSNSSTAFDLYVNGASFTFDSDAGIGYDAGQGNVGNFATENFVDNAVAPKQEKLESGENIKTINNQSILGSGNLSISADTSNCVKLTGTTSQEIRMITNFSETSIFGDGITIDSKNGPYANITVRQGNWPISLNVGNKNYIFNTSGLTIGEQTLTEQKIAQIGQGGGSGDVVDDYASAVAGQNVVLARYSNTTAKHIDRVHTQIGGLNKPFYIDSYGVVKECNEFQQKLTAGSGITISGNVISATGGGGTGATYTGGTNIVITGNTISTTASLTGITSIAAKDNEAFSITTKNGTTTHILTIGTDGKLKYDSKTLEVQAGSGITINSGGFVSVDTNMFIVDLAYSGKSLDDLVGSRTDAQMSSFGFTTAVLNDIFNGIKTRVKMHDKIDGYDEGGTIVLPIMVAEQSNSRCFIMVGYDNYLDDGCIIYTLERNHPLNQSGTWTISLTMS